MALYVAIQQVGGAQPTFFMKLACRMTAEQIRAYRGKRLPLDPDWMKANGYLNVSGWATSPIVDVHSGKGHLVLLIQTANSTYQVIPDFT